MRTRNISRLDEKLVSCWRSVSPFICAIRVSSCFLWVLAIGCGLALGNQKLRQSSDPTLACDTGIYSIHGGYPGARTGSCTVLGTNEVRLTIEPEDSGVINPSPWYGFRVAQRPSELSGNSQPLEVLLTYASGHEHRYSPKVSQDRFHWSPLAAPNLALHESAGSARLLLTVPESGLYVSAQPNLQADWYSSWTQQLHHAWPEMARELIGYSVERRPIEAMFSEREAPYLVVLLGRSHPPETTGAQALRDFMLHLASLRRDACASGHPAHICLFFVDYGFLLVPLVNPDGVAGGHWRHNANGVDLNRDWGVFSQPETKAVQKVVDSLLASGRELRLALDFHSTRRNVFFTQTDKDITDPPVFARQWLKRAAGIASTYEIDLPVYEYAPREVSDQGTAKNHFFVRYGVPSITYETGDETLSREIEQSSQTFARAMVDTLMSNTELPLTGVSPQACAEEDDCDSISSLELCNDFFCYMAEANKASLVMLRSRELVSKELAQDIGTALVRAIGEATEPGAVRTTNYLQLEKRLIELVGDEASNIHLGRSRQDLHGVTRRMLFRNQLLVVLEELVSTRESLLAKAHSTKDMVIPAYTHGVPSQPTTFGHQLAAFAGGLERDFDRLIAAYHRLNHSPLGAAAGSTSGFPLDSHLAADLLGFAAPVSNSYDANFLSSSDSRIEIANVLEGSALTVTQFVENIHAQQRNPWPWIYLAAEATSGSSIMPQKRNPRDLDRLRTSASSVIAQAQKLVLFAHNVDSGMHDYRQMAPMSELLVGANLMYRRLDLLINKLNLDKDKALEEINRGFSTMTEVADTVHRGTGIPFRTAHAFAAQLVDIARREEIRAIDLDEDAVRTAFRQVTGEELSIPIAVIHEALDPERFIQTRQGFGGPQVDEMVKSLSVLESALGADRQKLTGMKASLGIAHLKLQRRFERLLSSGSTLRGSD